MKVGGTGHAQGPNGAGRAGKSKAAGQGRFRLGSVGGADTVNASSSLTATAPVDALIALQEVETQGSSGAAVERAGRLLDVLDDIKLALLAGSVSKHALDRLLTLVNQRAESPAVFQDPRLAAVLDEIDLRARVELAKFDRAAAP